MARGKRTKTTRATATFPLALRLPNPPSVFVGRTREKEVLQRAITRAAVSCVCGLGGLGKTSLVLATLHEHFPDRVARTVMISIGRGQNADEVARLLIRALATGSLAW